MSKCSCGDQVFNADLPWSTEWNKKSESHHGRNTKSDYPSISHKHTRVWTAVKQMVCLVMLPNSNWCWCCSLTPCVVLHHSCLMLLCQTCDGVVLWWLLLHSAMYLKYLKWFRRTLCECVWVIFIVPPPVKKLALCERQHPINIQIALFVPQLVEQHKVCKACVFSHHIVDTGSCARWAICQFQPYTLYSISNVHFSSGQPQQNQHPAITPTCMQGWEGHFKYVLLVSCKNE